MDNVYSVIVLLIHNPAVAYIPYIRLVFQRETAACPKLYTHLDFWYHSWTGQDLASLNDVKSKLKRETNVNLDERIVEKYVFRGLIHHECYDFKRSSTLISCCLIGFLPGMANTIVLEFKISGGILTLSESSFLTFLLSVWPLLNLPVRSCSFISVGIASVTLLSSC